MKRYFTFFSSRAACTPGTFLLAFAVLIFTAVSGNVSAQAPSDTPRPTRNAKPPEAPAKAETPQPEAVAATDEAEPSEPPAPPVPVWDREPFDRIILKTTKKRNTFDIQPLEIPRDMRATPEELRKLTRKAKLQIRLLEDPENLREVSFDLLSKVMLYEEILVDEVRKLIVQKKFDEAYEGLKFLRADYPDARNLDQLYQFFLEREAANYIAQKNLEMALVRVYALVSLNPNYQNLAKVYVPLVEQLLKENLAKRNYAVAGQFMTELQKTLPNDPGTKKLAASINKLANSMLVKSQDALKKNDINTAIIASRSMVQLCPKRPDAIRISSEIRERYPQVNVGVTWCANQYQPLGLHDWASLRSQRLIYRPLVEFLGPGPEGGNYESPLSDMKAENLNRTVRMNLYDNVGWNATGAKLTAYDISYQLMEMINPQSAQFDPLFAEVFQEVEATSLNNLAIHFRRAHVIPMALLQTPVLPYTSGEEIRPDMATNGPFVLKAIDEKAALLRDGRPMTAEDAKRGGKAPAAPPAAEPVTTASVRYVASQNYFVDQLNADSDAKHRPLQIIETYYEKGRNAVLALRANEIQVLDRVNPWELETLRGEKNVTVVPYSVPRVHMLIPNRNTRVLSNRTFRRAVLYAINREVILSHILGGKSQPGCHVVSGPFSRGASYSDPLSYAYDSTLEPRKYEPYLATTLARVGVMQTKTPEELKKEEAARKKALREKQEAQQKWLEENPEGQLPEEEKPKKAPTLPMQPLVLGHPPHELARVVCGQIKIQLDLVGIPVTLYEFGMHEPVVMRDGIDLLYAETTISEPLLDARRLLGSQGPTHRSSSHMDLALRQLDAATDWVEIGRTLRRIHRLAHDDTAVIPLWQIVEHFAYNNSIEGVGESPFTLYENVEQWRLK